MWSSCIAGAATITLANSLHINDTGKLALSTVGGLANRHLASTASEKPDFNNHDLGFLVCGVFALWLKMGLAEAISPQ